jgi:hypothetical protein
MQPETPKPQPVMDVKAPQRPTVAPAPRANFGAPQNPQPAAPTASPVMAVHEAPKTEAEKASEKTAIPAQDAPKPETAAPIEAAKPQMPKQAVQPGVPLPVGAIVAAVIVMVLLVGLTVAAYINSNA